MEKTQYISVILPLKLEWEPCYRTTEDAKTGDRVKVKFANKEYIGVVTDTDITPEIDPKKINDVISLEKDMERVFPEEIELWRKVATYYMCTIGEVYKVAYPSGKINLEQSRAEARKKVCQRRERAIELIDSKLSKLHLRLQKKEEQFTKAKEGTKTKATLASDIQKIKEEIAIGRQAKASAENMLEVAKAGLQLKIDNALENNIILSNAQMKAFNEISDSFAQNRPALLHGVTGSGKTEIYIKLAHKCISEKKNVLYLVPEIALSRQLEERLYSHFGESLIVFHSGESQASRRNAAEMIRHSDSDGTNYIVLCTRSGIFLPHHNLGLIIVDEEHDTSYKQDSPAPRYNGRDTAIMLSLIQKECKIVIGSATPSMESIYNVQAGRYAMVRLQERYHANSDPEIEIIDTKAEWKKNGMVGNFSRKLIDNIKKTIERGEQVLILRSRRAWSTAMQCEACGEIQKCPHCNVSLSFHKTIGKIVCHYCGHTVQFKGKCSKCDGPLKHLGAGTQKIEEETRALFTEARIARLDSDSSQQKSYETKVIKDFANGEIDILIGTQIITKGFDFKNLTLVAIISADTLLSIQDFRADEKALQIIEQFKGRCGRRDKVGKLIIQTSQPDHPIYNQVVNQSEISYSNLMAERKEFDFPPFSRIIEISIKDKIENRAETAGNKLVTLLKNLLKDENSSQYASSCVSNIYAPIVDKIADIHIRKIRISLKKDRTLAIKKKLIRETILLFEKNSKYEGHLSIDVDPS